MNFNKINHICLHSSDYESTKTFYTKVLGFSIFSETFDPSTSKYTLKLELNDSFIEIVSVDSTKPDPKTLPHLAIEVDNIESAIVDLKNNGIDVEDLNKDCKTNKKYTFFKGPDNLWIKIFEKSMIDICLDTQYI